MTDEPNSARWLRMLIGVTVVTLSTVWAYRNLEQGWFPHDEGQLGQAAERVLAGEVPHRDFDDMYTGGLSYLNAISFHWWGVNSLSMRWMLLLFFVPYVISIYWLALHFVAPFAAGLVTLLAAAWSIPMYSAAMPSWYNLFFATWCLCAMLRFIQTGGKAYLLLAGLMIGLSIAFKISGLFVLAAVLLFLLYRNQLQRNGDDAELQSATGSMGSTGSVGLTRSKADVALSICVSVALVLASGLSLTFVNQHDSIMQGVHLVIPFASLCWFVLANEWRSPEAVVRLPRKRDDVENEPPNSHESSSFNNFHHENGSREAIGSSLHSGAIARLRTLLGNLIPLAIGVAIPLAVLVGFYVREGAFNALIDGALVMPKQRMEFAVAPFPQWKNLVFALPILPLLFPSLAGRMLRKQREQPILIAALAAGFVLLNLQHTPLGFSLGFQSVRNFSPLLVLGNLVLLLRFSSHLTSLQRQQFFLVTVVAFFVSLIQFPFAVPIYWFYAAPLFLLAALAAAEFQEWVPKKTLLAMVVFLILIAVTRYHNPLPNISMVASYPFQPAAAWLDGRTQLLETATARLKTNRSQLLVDSRQADVYNELQIVIDQHTNRGDTIFATPDSPEVGYLTGRKSFNGVMYEFFHKDLYNDLPALKSELAAAKVNLVVIKEAPEFSLKVTAPFRDTVLADFELVKTIYFEIDLNERTPLFRVYLRRSESLPD